MFSVQPRWATGSFSDGLISFSMAYFEDIGKFKKNFKIAGRIFDFTSLSILKKHLWLGQYSLFQHKNLPYYRGIDDLYSIYFRPYTIILKD